MAQSDIKFDFNCIQRNPMLKHKQLHHQQTSIVPLFLKLQEEHGGGRRTLERHGGLVVVGVDPREVLV